MPAYWILAILYTIYHIVLLYLGNHNNEVITYIKDSVILFPIETIGLQSAFSSLFSIVHNSGTWFVSCLIFCYLAFPLLKQITDELSTKSKTLFIVVLGFILLYSPLVSGYYRIEMLYTNIIFRIFEFSIGVLLATLNIDDKFSKIMNNWTAFVIEWIILIVGVTIANRIGIRHDYMLYSWIGLPCFMAMIITLAHIKSNKVIESKTMSYACKISYMFFFAQFFTWSITRNLLKITGLQDYNLIRIVCSFAICLIIAATLNKFFEEPLKNKMRKLLICQ